MKIKKINILLFVQNNFHELLLIKEIQLRLPEYNIISVQTKSEAIKVIASELIQAVLVDINSSEQEDICNVHHLHFANTDMPIIAFVDDTSDKFSKEMLEIGVTELLQKNETFYVVVPQLLKEVLSREVKSREVQSSKRNSKQSELLKLTSRTLSHEINNPLMTILGITELILDDQLGIDKDLIKKIKTIQKSALRIQKSTHRMSHISTPVYHKTPVGVMIDPLKSRIYTKTKVKLSETE